jgi:hypothetical protein
MILTIETNKDAFINAIVELCKVSGIFTYKVEKNLTNPTIPTDTNEQEMDTTSENEEIIIAHFKKNIDKIRYPQTSMSSDDFFKVLAND